MIQYCGVRAVYECIAKEKCGRRFSTLPPLSYYSSLSKYGINCSTLVHNFHMLDKISKQKKTSFICIDKRVYRTDVELLYQYFIGQKGSEPLERKVGGKFHV